MTLTGFIVFPTATHNSYTRPFWIADKIWVVCGNSEVWSQAKSYHPLDGPSSPICPSVLSVCSPICSQCQGEGHCGVAHQPKKSPTFCAQFTSSIDSAVWLHAHKELWYLAVFCSQGVRDVSDGVSWDVQHNVPLFCVWLKEDLCTIVRHTIIMQYKYVMGRKLSAFFSVRSCVWTGHNKGLVCRI